MASSIRPLYSAALGLIELSVFLGATFTATISADLGSAGFASALAPAAKSLGCGEVSVPAELAAEPSEAVCVAVGTAADKLPPFFCESCSSRAASKTGLILFAP